MKFNFKRILMLLLIIFVVLFAVTTITDNLSDEEEIQYSDIVYCFENDIVDSFVINGDMVIKLVLVDGTKIEYQITISEQLEQIHRYAVSGELKNL